MESSRKAEAIEKLVRPPMLASVDMKNEPSSILPGKITYVQALSADKGMRPAYTVNPMLREMMEDIKEIQVRINEGFFGNLFLSLESVTKQMTAFEVAQRNSEKLQVLGPVVERLQNECLAPAIKRVFRIMERRGVLPPLPPSLQNVPIGIEYVGILALAQKASKTASLERFAQVMNQLAQTDPQVMDTWNSDIWVREMSEDLFLPAKILRDPKEVAAIRAQRAKAMQAQQQLGAAQSIAKTAQTAGNIDLGGGITAAGLMTGLGGATPQGNA